MRIKSETTKENIVTAAHILFLDHGFAATNMDDIASEAKVAKQTLYGYFPDKRALFMAVIERAVGTPWEFGPEPVLIKTTEQLRTTLYTILAGINAVSMRPEYIKLLRTIVSEANQQPELGDLFRKGVTYRSLQALTALFVESNDAGVTTIANPGLAARFFLGGMVIRIFLDGLLANTPNIQKLADEELHEYVDAFVQCVTSLKKEG